MLPQDPANSLMTTGQIMHVFEAFCTHEGIAFPKINDPSFQLSRAGEVLCGQCRGILASSFRPVKRS